jgi:hypothetical protein
MEQQRVWQVIIVDWDAGQYATIDAPADDKDWNKEVDTEKKKGRDIHCFHHDVADTSGLRHWAEQHELTQTRVHDIMPIS